MDNHEEEKEPLIAQSRAGEAGANLSVGLAAIRPMFEKWYMAEMDASATFDRWLDTDYYEDSDIQRAWRGYQAAAADKAANVELTRLAEGQSGGAQRNES